MNGVTHRAAIPPPLMGCQKSGSASGAGLCFSEQGAKAEVEVRRLRFDCAFVTTVTRCPRARNIAPKPKYGKTSPSVPTVTRIACIVFHKWCHPAN